MKTIESLKNIYKEDKKIIALMVLVLLMAIFFIIMVLPGLKAGTGAVKIGYSDIGKADGGGTLRMQSGGGYKDGSIWELVAFSVFGLLVGVGHNLLAVRMYEKRGKVMTVAVLGVSVVLLGIATVIIKRLLGEW